MFGARLASLGCLVLSVGCSLFASTPETPVQPPSIGIFSRLSDVDVIQDVAVTNEHLWVATSRGIVRHPLAGGDAVRLGEAEGLPSGDVIAIAANETAGWAATASGIVKLTSAGVERLPDTPSLGVPTALAVGADGAVWLGGTAGVGRSDGTTWQKFSDRYHVTSFAPEADGVWMGTKESGAVRLHGGVFFEHTISIGLPSNFVRSIVSLGGGKALALCQTPSGSSIGYFDGAHWFGYAVPLEEPLLGLVLLDGAPAVYTRSHVYGLTLAQDGEATVLIPISGAGEGSPRQFRARPEAVQAGSTPPPAVPMPVQPALVAPPPAQHPAPTKTAAGAQAPVSAEVAPAVVAPPPVETPAPPREALVPAVRPLPPPDEGQEFEAPRWQIADLGTSPSARIGLARARGNALYLATVGLGVSRFVGGRETAFRTRDLIVTDRAFSIGTDGQGNSWILTKAHEAARFDGETIERVPVDSDPAIRIMAFASTSGAVFALGHADNTDWWRCYRSEGGAFRMVVERQLMAEAGVSDVSFFAVDTGGRFWLGIKARTERGTVVERGVAVIDANVPAVVYHHSRANPETDGQGAMRVPDSVSAIAFAENGDIWLAGLDGAARISSGEITRYGESQGLEGELVGDLDIGPGSVPYIATPEGIGHYDGSRWLFERDSVVTQAHPTALAIDGQGHVWAGGSRGALYGNGRRWRRLGMSDGLLADQLTDIRVDGANRVWFVTSEGLTVLARP